MGLGSLALGDYLLVLFGHVPFSRVDSAWDQHLSYLKRFKSFHFRVKPGTYLEFCFFSCALTRPAKIFAFVLRTRQRRLRVHENRLHYKNNHMCT